MPWHVANCRLQLWRLKLAFNTLYENSRCGDNHRFLLNLVHLGHVLCGYRVDPLHSVRAKVFVIEYDISPS
jgi:hypothetical protein